MTLRVRLAAAAVVLLLLATFFYAPVVTCSKSLALPNSYKADAFRICTSEAGIQTNGTFASGFNLTQAQVYQACLNREQYPAYNLTGHASLSYELLGVGTPPYPGSFQFTQGNYTGLVYFDGDKIGSAYEMYGTPGNLVVGDGGVFELLNASVGRNGYGMIVFNATVRNTSKVPLTGVSVGVTGLTSAPDSGFLWPGGYNVTRDGQAWTVPYGAGDCSEYLPPGQTCAAGGVLVQYNSTQLHFFVYVTGTANGTLHFYRQEFSQSMPAEGSGPGWVHLFIDKVNQARAGHPLKENSTLDEFAATRFKTASSQPQISDYNFANDVHSFFGAAGASVNVEELLLYPGTQAPYYYATELQSAPIHWSAITNPQFTQYGYYMGKAPYFEVSASCPTTELPSQGINITQYFEGMGCLVTPTSNATWLVLILSP